MKNVEVLRHLREAAEERKHMPLNIQFFAGDDDNGDDTGGDDQDNQDDDDPDGDDDDNGDDEPKYTQADIDAAVKERLARERRKWQRQQSRTKKPDKKQEAKKEPEGDDNQESEIQTRLSAAEQRAEAAEIKALCLERDVNKNAVADVVVLAQARTKDGLDIEDAIDEVLDDYPHFKREVGADADDDASGKPKKKAKFVRGTNSADKPEKKTEQRAYLDSKYGKNPYYKKTT